MSHQLPPVPKKTCIGGLSSDNDEVFGHTDDAMRTYAELAIASVKPGQFKDSAAFKNFHRSLCERFGYFHDEQYWWRDLMSLEEHIAASVNLEPQWLPIESAPKDGAALILSVIENGNVFDVVHGYFEVVPDDEDDGPWDIRDGDPWCSYVGRREGTYFCNWLEGKQIETDWLVTKDFPYTHWMPRPQPPITGSEGDGNG